MAVLLVDGNWLAARAAFALPESIRTQSGNPANVVYGFFTALAKDLRATAPTALAVAFDAPGPTFRHELYASYKANRVKLPASFHKQLELVKDFLDTLDTTRCEIDQLEADDVIASWANQAARQGVSADILSGDRDIAQLVEDPLIHLLSRDPHGDGTVSVALNEEAVYSRFGVWPREYVLYASLRGDPSDNLPGVPGVGAKTAARLVRKYGSLDLLLEKSGELPSKLAHAIRENIERARSNIRLMRLVNDASVPWPLPSFSEQMNWEARLRELFNQVGLQMRIRQSAPVAKRRQPDRHAKRPAAISAPHPVRRVCLVSCVAQKAGSRLPAKDLYASTLFRSSRAWAERMANDWYILSAKHGLVDPDRPLDPYDLSLKQLGVHELEEWRIRVISALQEKVITGDIITLLASRAYITPIESWLRDAGVRIHVPLDGRSLGFRLHWLQHALLAPDQRPHLERFYQLLSCLRAGIGGPRHLQECNGRMGWPKRGVYFFLEPSEPRVGHLDLRVTRVGTHAVGRGAKSSLWGRLRTHKGLEQGGGSHRSSVFRLHVGAALITRGNKRSKYQYWGGPASSEPESRIREQELEAEVSRHIGSMEVLAIDVGDLPSPASDRAYIERNAIALLSVTGAFVDPPTGTWLGLDSPSSVIRRTGLWNLQHSEANFDARFLDVLETYIEVTLGRRSSPIDSIAPAGWWQQNSGSDLGQMALF